MADGFSDINCTITIQKYMYGTTDKGNFDASAIDYSAIASAIKNDYYTISVAGTISGTTWAIGDRLVINTTTTSTPINLYIDKVPASAITISGDIFEFKQSPLSKKIAFKRVYGGMTIPDITTTESTEISFKFISNDGTYDNFVGDNLATNDPEWDRDIKYLVQLTFDSGDEQYYKLYFNAYITSFDSNIQDNILKGEIKLILPLKNINGRSNFLTGTTASVVNAYKTTMGY